MSPTASATRLERTREALERAGADWLVVPPSADFVWLTGARARGFERLVAYALPRRGEPFCVVPRLEADALAQEAPGLDLEVWDEHEDALERLMRRMGLARRARVLVAEGLRVRSLLRLAAAADCGAADEVLGPLRAVKDPEEIARLAEAGRHADQVVEEAADFARPGMTEAEVGRFVADRFVALGDTEPWQIVASGPNAALPHHLTSERRIGENDCLLIDCGALTDGYCSDITRTYWLGDVPAEALRVHDVVNEARAAAIAGVRAGAIPEEVDRAARGVIERAGYGEFFTHRTGHGLGREIHETPYIVTGNRVPLVAGNVHSVEPGIYLPGRFGVRLEDIVVVEEGGARRLNVAPFDLRPPRLRA